MCIRVVTLPIGPPVSPMLAKLARELPRGDQWCYEPKWDGLRGIVFRDGDDVELTSRNERPLTRYFPELVDPPAAFVAFDLLAEGARDLRTRPFDARRAALERALAQAKPPVHLTPLREDALAEHPWAGDGPGRMPGAPSRWNAQKDLSWEPLRIALVAEVAYEHLQGDCFRHTAGFQRWRPDREPPSCTYAQLEVPVPVELQRVFA